MSKFNDKSNCTSLGNNIVGDDENKNNFCFLQVSLAGRPPQLIVVELFRSIVPQTCDNFASLCQAPGRTTLQRPVPTYRGCIFHRVVPGFMVQGGDFEHFSGSGGYSTFTTKTFHDENFILQHDRMGRVSMANKGTNTNGSQFFITLQPTPHLNGKHVVFGQVVGGMDVIQAMAADIELEGTRPTSMQKVVILDCGIGKGPSATSDLEITSSGDDSERVDVKKDRKRRKSGDKHHKRKRMKKGDKHKKRHRKRRKRKRRKHDSASDDNDDKSSSEGSDDTDTDSDENNKHKNRRDRKRHKDKQRNTSSSYRKRSRTREHKHKQARYSDSSSVSSDG